MAVTASEKRGIGTRLRRARVEQGIELVQAAKATRITPRYLQALERDAPPDVFPAPVYARAFLREYAQWLGLDPTPLVDSYVEHHPDPVQPLVLPTPLQKPPGRWLRRGLVAASVTLLLTLLVVSTRSRAPSRPQPPSVPSPVGSAAPVIGATENSAAPAPRAIVLALDIVERACWVRITSDGRLAMQTILQPGFTKTFTAERRLDVWLGNAGAVRLTLNGRSVRLPGPGQIYRAGFTLRNGKVRTGPYRSS